MSENPAKPSFFKYDAKIEKELEKAIRPRPLTRQLRDMYVPRIAQPIQTVVISKLSSTRLPDKIAYMR